LATSTTKTENSLTTLGVQSDYMSGSMYTPSCKGKELRVHKINHKTATYVCKSRVQVCNYVKFKTGQNLPPVLKID